MVTTDSWTRGRVERNQLGAWIWKHGLSGGLFGAIIRGDVNGQNQCWDEIGSVLKEVGNDLNALLMA
jgi:hypothetical protein